MSQMGYTNVTNVRGGFVGAMDNSGRVTEPGWSMLNLPPVPVRREASYECSRQSAEGVSVQLSLLLTRLKLERIANRVIGVSTLRLLCFSLRYPDSSLQARSLRWRRRHCCCRSARLCALNCS